MFGAMHRILTYNLPLKIFSLFLTILIYLIAASQQPGVIVEKQHRVVSVNAKYKNLSQGLEVISPPPSLKIEAAGPADIINEAENFIEVELNMSGAEVGTHTLNPILKKSSEQIEIISVNPKYIQVELDEKITRHYKIELYVPMDMSGFKWSVTPGEVQVTGARSRFETLYQIVARPPALNPGELAGVKLEAVDAQQEKIHGLRIIPDEVVVQRMAN